MLIAISKLGRGSGEGFVGGMHEIGNSLREDELGSSSVYELSH